jgi:hypothetical protein
VPGHPVIGAVLADREVLNGGASGRCRCGARRGGGGAGPGARAEGQEHADGWYARD